MCSQLQNDYLRAGCRKATSRSLVVLTAPRHGEIPKGAAMGYKLKDLSGQKFNRLTAISYDKDNGKWLCRCDCNAITRVTRDQLISGRTKSCGCFSRESKLTRLLKHGAARKGKITTEYMCWRNMLTRCYYKKSKCFHNYGGRGITVCERWHTFEHFLADMGERPANMTIDRKDNNGPYCKENCRWATKQEQVTNRRTNRLITFNGTTKTLSQWATEIGIDSTTIAFRLKSGWTIEQAMRVPVDASISNQSKRNYELQ